MAFLDVTREQPEPNEERIEETRQQEAQPVVVAGKQFYYCISSYFADILIDHASEIDLCKPEINVATNIQI